MGLVAEEEEKAETADDVGDDGDGDDDDDDKVDSSQEQHHHTVSIGPKTILKYANSPFQACLLHSFSWTPLFHWCCTSTNVHRIRSIDKVVLYFVASEIPRVFDTHSTLPLDYQLPIAPPLPLPPPLPQHCHHHHHRYHESLPWHQQACHYRGAFKGIRYDYVPKVPQKRYVYLLAYSRSS